ARPRPDRQHRRLRRPHPQPALHLRRGDGRHHRPLGARHHLRRRLPVPVARLPARAHRARLRHHRLAVQRDRQAVDLRRIATGRVPGRGQDRPPDRRGRPVRLGRVHHLLRHRRPGHRHHARPAAVAGRHLGGRHHVAPVAPAAGAVRVEALPLRRSGRPGRGRGQPRRAGARAALVVAYAAVTFGPYVNPANAITASRYLTLPPFWYWLDSGDYQLATLMVIVCGVLDLFDGAVARAFNCSSGFGELLDAITDALCYGYFLVLLAFYDRLPAVPVAGILGVGVVNAGFRAVYAR